MKLALTSEPLLVLPGYARDFFLECDGSGEGPGAVLFQDTDDGEKVIAFFLPTLPHGTREKMHGH